MSSNDQAIPPNIQATGFTGYCMALGYIQANWAQMEQMFDMWIALVYHELGGRDSIDSRLPLSFKSKVKFLKRSFGRISALNEYAQDALPLLQRAKALAGKRNDLVHGALTAQEPIDGNWQMAILDFETPQDSVNWHVLRRFTFNQQDFQDFESNLVPLSVEVAQFGRRLIDLVRARR